MSLSITKNYSDGNTLTAAELTTAFTDIETKFNTTLIAGSEIQSNTIGTTNLIDLNVTTGKIADSAVTTAKIADSNVTTAKIADSNITTAKIADANVTTAKIADAAITPAKLTAFNYAQSSDIGLVSESAGVFTQLASVSITTNGRPVWIGLNPGSNAALYGYTLSIHTNSGSVSGATQSAYVQFKRNSTTAGITYFGADGDSTHQGNVLPISAFHCIDFPTAGTYTYTVGFALNAITNSPTVTIDHGTLIAFEL